jgi:holo-[acyl-carrier protein] synthase
VIGIGTDIVNIERIERIFEKFGQSFVDKNFHELEIKQFNLLKKESKCAYLAKRFAGKEAVAKALGEGVGKNLSFKDIAIINDELGAPKVMISAVVYPGIDKYKFHISLSDDYPFAVAFVVISN